MKILLSAYSCEPGRGSEPGVGWNWAMQIAARGHYTWVFTRENNRKLIEQSAYDRERISFFFYDLPPVFLKLKRYLGVYFYYLCWQVGGAYQLRKLHRSVQFDVVHHITFGVFRHPGILWLLIKAPFVFGPVGGGETTPMRLRRSWALKNRLKERLRDLMNALSYYEPWYRFALRHTALIVCKTPETARFIPSAYRHKTEVMIEIGRPPVIPPDPGSASPDKAARDRPEILFVGRFTYWKGPFLVLKAFKQIALKFPAARLTMIGKGPDRQNLERMQARLGLTNLRWVSWLSQEELGTYYRNADVFLFPSLHDSSGNVVLEAMAYGLPVVCTDLGGPAVILGDHMDTIVPATDSDSDELAALLATEVIQLVSEPGRLAALAELAATRADELTWKATVGRLYSIIEERWQPLNS